MISSITLSAAHIRKRLPSYVIAWNSSTKTVHVAEILTRGAMGSLFSILICNHISLSRDSPELHTQIRLMLHFNLTQQALPKVLILDGCPRARFPMLS